MFVKKPVLPPVSARKLQKNMLTLVKRSDVRVPGKKRKLEADDETDREDEKK